MPRLARAAAATPLFDRKPDHAEKAPLPPTHLYLTVWPSGLRRWLQAPVRKGVGSNPTAVICARPRKPAGAQFYEPNSERLVY